MMASRGGTRAWRRACAALAVLCAPVLAHSQSPAPATAGAPEPAASLRTQLVRPGLTVITGAGGNVVVWSGPEGVVLVDTGLATTATALAEAVASLSTSPVRFVINTHGHADHVGGNQVFARQGAVLVGHESLREQGGLDPATPVGNAETMLVGARPVLTTQEAFALHLNGDRLDAVHVANGHTAADIVVRWNEADVVALGDIYWSGQYPYIDVESGGSLAGLVAAIEAVLARANARTIVIPGHGPVSNRAELAAYRDMLVAVGRSLRESVESGMGIEQILDSKPTAEFDARFARPGAIVAPEEFVRSVYRDLASQRPGR